MLYFKLLIDRIRKKVNIPKTCVEFEILIRIQHHVLERFAFLSDTINACVNECMYEFVRHVLYSTCMNAALLSTKVIVEIDCTEYPVVRWAGEQILSSSIMRTQETQSEMPF